MQEDLEEEERRRKEWEEHVKKLREQEEEWFQESYEQWRKLQEYHRRRAMLLRPVDILALFEVTEIVSKALRKLRGED